MLNKLIKIVFTSFILGITACGYHFQNGQLIPQELQTIAFESSDPYSEMSIAMRHQLQRNNVKIVNANDNVAILRIQKVNTNSDVVSVFKQGREAEKILSMTVTASFRLPNKDAHEISSNVNRTFFDNSRAALAKSAEKDVIWQSMYEQAARQLISKMVSLHH